MGYSTDFSGQFHFDKPLDPNMCNFLKLFAETRRMKRKVDEAFGVDGEFYVFGSGSYGQDKDDTIIDYNTPPSTQPRLWCQWVPTEDGMGLEWDGSEKFYAYSEWLVYLIEKVLAPNGYVLNGTVKWSGEDTEDVGKIIVTDNVVYVEPWDSEGKVINAQNSEKYEYPSGVIKGFMHPEVVLLLDKLPLL